MASPFSTPVTCTLLNSASALEGSERTTVQFPPHSVVVSGSADDLDSEGELEEKEETVYQKAFKHWSTIQSDVDGMLGGCSRLHTPDIAGSKAFINTLIKKGHLPRQHHAIDCGSGIGRVTKHLLLPHFAHVDMIDFSPTFIQQARAYIGEEAFTSQRVDTCFVESIHTFVPPAGKYDLVWVQWVSGYLTDADLIAFLQRAADSLTTGSTNNCTTCNKSDCSSNRCDGSSGSGCIIIKDNVKRLFEEEEEKESVAVGDDVVNHPHCSTAAASLATAAPCDFDEVDSSWTRPRRLLLALFETAGLELVAEKRQHNFPKGFYEVRMFALRRREKKKKEGEKEMAAARGSNDVDDEHAAAGDKTSC